MPVDNDDDDVVVVAVERERFVPESLVETASGPSVVSDGVVSVVLVAGERLVPESLVVLRLSGVETAYVVSDGVVSVVLAASGMLGVGPRKNSQQ